MSDERLVPDARKAICVLGGEPNEASVNWTATARIVIDGHEWLVTIKDERLSASRRALLRSV
jgi:hypothetical protein